MSPRGLAENEFHVVKRDGASTSRPIDIPPRSALAKAPANARKCSPGRFQFLSRVLREGERGEEWGGEKIHSILETCNGVAIVPISFRLTAKYRLVRTGSGVGGTVEGGKRLCSNKFYLFLFLNFRGSLIL